MIKFIKTNGTIEYELLEEMEKRNSTTGQNVDQLVSDIIRDVRENGDEALRRYNEKFDGGCPEVLEVDREALKIAFEAAEENFRDAIIRAAANIRKYHEKQVQEGYEAKVQEGIVLGQVIRGLEKVGLYVPGGTAAYPSTVLMNGIPAKIAGVEELIMVTPPMKETLTDGTITYKANPDILTAAYVAGVDRVILSGGAQIVAALAYGTESIPRVDKIVGPGNIFVATAKKQLFGQVDIDMIAGPSEILIIADETANPAYIAADMLSQAEHDKMSASILLTTSEKIADETKKELAVQTEKLERSEIIKASLAGYGLIAICRSTGEMIELANRIAPEHLEILMEEPLAYVPEIRNAGSVFCGSYAPEPLGDYYSGTNHVLPTSGTARFASPLGVYDFVKRMSYTYYTKDALKEAKDDIIAIGEKEGLTAHANAIRIRFE